MAKLLCENLTLTERVFLNELRNHNGYKVIQKLLSDACLKATADVISLNPLEAEYNRRLAYLQQRSRVYNEFSADLLASMEWHGTEGVVQSKEAEKEDAQVDRLLTLARTTNPSDNSK